MNKFYIFFNKLSAWFYICGSLLFFISNFFLDSTYGIVLFLLGSLAFFSDPIFTIIQKKKRAESLRNYILIYSFGLVALVAFFGRQLIEVPVSAFVDGEDSLLLRIKLALLFVFILSYIASLVARLMSHLSQAGHHHNDGEGHLATRRLYLRNALFSILSMLVFLVTVNYVTTLRNPVIDFMGNLSFGNEASTVISSIENKVVVYVFLPDVQNVKTRGRTGTNELSKISEDIRLIAEQLPVINSKIKVEFLNADLAAFKSNEFGSVNNGTMIVRRYRSEVSGKDEKPYIERRVYIYTAKDMKKIEKEVTRALVYVSSKKINVYFASSNGERYDSARGPNDQTGLDLFKKQLRFFNATLRKLDHNNKWPGPIPEDCDILFLMGAKIAYGKEARKSIRDYILRGGDVFASVDPAGKEDLDWLLKSMGGKRYSYSKEILFNTRWNAVAVTDSTGTHRITDSFTGTTRPPVILLKNGYFDTKKEAPSPVTKTNKSDKIKKTNKLTELSQLSPSEILFSTHNTHVDRNRNSLPDKNEQIGRKPVVIAYEQPKNPDSPKVVVFSGIDFLSNQAMNFPSVNSNLQIALDSILWMTENPMIAGLVPEESQSKTIQLTDAIKLRLLILGVLVFPLLMSGGLALLIRLYRKKRRFIEA